VLIALFAGLAAATYGGDQPLEIYAGLVALLLNLTVVVAGTAALERFGVPRGADLTDLPSRLTVRRRPETGASNP
jgi:SSS family solute:Na+ symporter